MNHDTAIEIHIARGIGHFLPIEPILHAQDVMRVGNIGVEMSEFSVELRILIVASFENAIFDVEGIVRVFARGRADDFRRPAAQIFAVEKRHPLGFSGFAGRKGQ